MYCIHTHHANKSNHSLSSRCGHVRVAQKIRRIRYPPRPLPGEVVLELALSPPDVVQVREVLGGEEHELLRAPHLAEQVLVVVVVEDGRRSSCVGVIVVRTSMGALGGPRGIRSIACGVNRSHLSQHGADSEIMRLWSRFDL